MQLLVSKSENPIPIGYFRPAFLKGAEKVEQQ